MEQNSEKYQDHQPQIRRYLTGTQYLNDVFQFKKKNDHSFSYEIWAAQLGFKSKSTLRMICKGERNISDDFVELFSAKERFSIDEKDYFYLLAKIQNCRNSELKKIYLDKLAELSLFSEQKADIKNIQEFLSDVNLMKTLVVIAFDDFEANEKNIRQLFGFTKADYDVIMHKLESMELIQSYLFEGQIDKLWKTTNKYFSVTDEAHDLAMTVYHQQTAREFVDQLKIVDVNRKIKSLNMALSIEDYQELANMMDLFVNKMKNKYGKTQLKGKRLYKINLQAYPVSEEWEK